jgi:hypothetical protein
MVNTIVEKPLSSKKRATSPTDRQHSGQAGVSKTASTLSACIWSATLGIVFVSNSEGSGWKP